jgi:transcriptional regulator with XRE-family HTH domain
VIGVADGSDVRGAGAGDAARRAELGAFLRARRAAVKPGDVGLPEGTSRRRTPGLRREEVAQLAGVGIAWYTWLEQGRVLATSPQVIDAVARALLLTHEEHAHLRALANLPPPTRPDRGGVLAASIRRMVDNLSPNPAYVLDRRFDFLTWNDAYFGCGATSRRSLLTGVTSSGCSSPTRACALWWSTGKRARPRCSPSSTPWSGATQRTSGWPNSSTT